MTKYKTTKWALWVILNLLIIWGILSIMIYINIPKWVFYTSMFIYGWFFREITSIAFNYVNRFIKQ